MGKKITGFAVLFILAGVAVYIYFNVPAAQEKIAYYTEENFIEDNIYTDLESISERLNEEILSGSDSFIIYLKDIDVSEINQINEFLNGIFGSGATYKQTGAIGNTYKKVAITIKHTINYYAVQAYLNQAPIPESEPKAEKLYEAIKNIMDTLMEEPMTDYEKELALHDYLITHCRYSENAEQPSDSDIYRAYGALVNQDAVCNGYAEALQLLLMCAGIKSEFVIGSARGVDHAWNLVELDGKWYHLDVTWDDPLPDQGENTLHSYFNVTDEIMAESHTWDRKSYPAALDMDYNYYVQNGLYFYSFADYKPQAYDAMVEGGTNRYEAVIENYIENKDDMQFIFENNYRYSSVNWQTFKEGKYNVLVLNAE